MFVLTIATLTLDNDFCQKLPDAAKNSLARVFNKRKPRRGLEPVTPEAMTLTGEVTLMLDRRLFPHDSEMDEKCIEGLENAETVDLVDVGALTLSHAPIGDLSPSSVYVELSPDKARELVLMHIEPCVQAVGARIRHYRKAIEERGHQAKLRAEAERQRAVLRVRDRLDALRNLRRLDSATAAKLADIPALVQASAATDEEKKAVIEAFVGVVMGAETYTKALEEARAEVASARGQFPCGPRGAW
jgi:hypothetical protein